MFRNRLKAFTLSELLIALLILGVIATFTIPKILSSTSDAKNKTLLKETVSILNQHLYRLTLLGIPLTTKLFYDQARDNSNFTFFCPTDSANEGCWDESIQGVTGEANMAGMLLHNGVSIIGINNFDLVHGADSVQIDLNGPEGPNTLGQDQIKLVICFSPSVDTSCNDWTTGYTGKVAAGTVTPDGNPANQALWGATFGN